MTRAAIRPNALIALGAAFAWLLISSVATAQERSLMSSGDLAQMQEFIRLRDQYEAVCAKPNRSAADLAAAAQAAAALKNNLPRLQAALGSLIAKLKAGGKFGAAVDSSFGNRHQPSSAAVSFVNRRGGASKALESAANTPHTAFDNDVDKCASSSRPVDASQGTTRSFFGDFYAALACSGEIAISVACEFSLSGNLTDSRGTSCLKEEAAADKCIANHQ